MNKFILMLLASIGLAFICGCDGSTSQVKNGILSQHPDVTVGAAFDSSFDNAKWETLADKGRKIVRFTGKIKQSTHDAAAKKAIFDESFIVQNYKNEEFEKRIAPYQEKQKSIDAKIKAIYQILDKRKDQYHDLTEEEETAETNYSRNRTPANEKILNEITNKKKLMVKENEELAQKIDEYKTDLQPLYQEQNLASQKIVKDLIEDFKRDSYWPTGQDVEFSFIVYPDGKQFEIDSFSNESWAKLKLPMESVLNIIFIK